MKMSLNCKPTANFNGCTGKVDIINPPVDVQIDGISITKDGIANIPLSLLLPFDKYMDSSFATKVTNDESPNIITSLMSVIIGSNNQMDAAKSLIIGSNNINTYAIPNPTTGEIDIGGNNNLIIGANNTVIAAAGMVNGNGNIVGDIDGTGIIKRRNQVNNCLVTGVKNNVQNTIRSLISGEENIVTDTGTSFISGKKNTVHNYSTVSLLGEGLIATSHYQTVVGTYNDPNDKSGYFMVGCGTQSAPLTVFKVAKAEITNNAPAIFNKTVTVKGGTTINGTFVTNSIASIGTTLTANHDLVSKRAVYSPNYFKGSNGYGNALLSRDEIKQEYPTRNEMTNTIDSAFASLTHYYHYIEMPCKNGKEGYNTYIRLSTKTHRADKYPTLDEFMPDGFRIFQFAMLDVLDGSTSICKIPIFIYGKTRDLLYCYTLGSGWEYTAGEELYFFIDFPDTLHDTVFTEY